MFLLQVEGLYYTMEDRLSGTHLLSSFALLATAFLPLAAVEAFFAKTFLVTPTTLHGRHAAAWFAATLRSAETFAPALATHAATHATTLVHHGLAPTSILAHGLSASLVSPSSTATAPCAIAATRATIPGAIATAAAVALVVSSITAVTTIASSSSVIAAEIARATAAAGGSVSTIGDDGLFIIASCARPYATSAFAAAAPASIHSFVHGCDLTLGPRP
mmetsp:Transcript_125252/g.243788  ORF Transcript_125252/g.243788 Transcript_125252/m.243788 type:complete len:219 (-) Transcript_125252:2-658(-)